MLDYHSKNYANLPIMNPGPAPEQALSDDPYESSDNDSLVNAMDNLNMVMKFLNEMHVSGLTGVEVARKWEREIEEENHVKKQMNENRVEEWRKMVNL